MLRNSPSAIVGALIRTQRFREKQVKKHHLGVNFRTGVFLCGLPPPRIVGDAALAEEPRDLPRATRIRAGRGRRAGGAGDHIQPAGYSSYVIGARGK